MVSSNPLPTTDIGNMVLEWLKNLDPLAYMRFASVYKDFENVKDLKKELEDLI
jgi:transcriptional repressor NrdR